MRSGNKFICNHPDCLSSCELANPDDLRSVNKALSQRGWVTVENKDSTDDHFCPAHHPATNKED